MKKFTACIITYIIVFELLYCQQDLLYEPEIILESAGQENYLSDNINIETEITDDAFFTGQKPSSKPQIAGGGMGGRRGGRKMQSGGSVETNTSKTYTPRRRRPSGNYIKKPMIVPPKKVDPGKNVQQ